MEKHKTLQDIAVLWRQFRGKETIPKGLWRMMRDKLRTFTGRDEREQADRSLPCHCGEPCGSEISVSPQGHGVKIVTNNSTDSECDYRRIVVVLRPSGALALMDEIANSLLHQYPKDGGADRKPLQLRLDTPAPAPTDAQVSLDNNVRPPIPIHWRTGSPEHRWNATLGFLDTLNLASSRTSGWRYCELISGGVCVWGLGNTWHFDDEPMPTRRSVTMFIHSSTGNLVALFDGSGGRINYEGVFRSPRRSASGLILSDTVPQTIGMSVMRFSAGIFSAPQVVQAILNSGYADTTLLDEVTANMNRGESNGPEAEADLQDDATAT